MSKRTIKPIHIVLPDADNGYYRFGDLPRLIADFLYPEDPDADEEAQELQWMKHGWDGVETFQEDLARAAGLTEGEPGYLHVVENSPSKRPLKWRMGAVLEAGLVHLDWLNEWGESRMPPLVFSTVSAPEPQAATPEPVVAESASKEFVIPFKKAALIAAHVHEWPTIERDIADANTNGLAAAAKAGARGWLEDAALMWARANGKLISAAKPADSLAQAMHNLGALPSRKHTMQG